MSIPLERKDASFGPDPLLLAAFNATADAFVVVDSRQRVQHINAAAVALLGIAAAEAVGRAWHEVVNFIEGGPRHLRAQGRLQPSRPWRPITPPCARDDGLHKAVAARIEAVASGAADGRQGALITLRAYDPVVALKNALDGAEQRLRIALAGGQVGLWEWQTDTDVLRESGYWVGRTVHTAESAADSGQHMLDNTHPDDVERVRQALIAHLRGETEHYEVEQRVRLIEGGYVRFLVRGQFSDRGSDGRARYLMGTYTDITALREQEQLLRFALESSQQGIWEWNIDNNRIVEHRFWRPQRDRYDIGSPLTGADLLNYAHPDDVPQVYEQVLQHLRGNSDAIEVELRVRRRDGSYGYFLVRGRAPERDQHGRCERMIGTYTEITNLKANERVLQIALENGRQGLFDWDPDADHIEFSREWYAMLGYPEGSITSHSDNVARILHPDDRAAGRAVLIPMLKGEVRRLPGRASFPSPRRPLSQYPLARARDRTQQRWSRQACDWHPCRCHGAESHRGASARLASIAGDRARRPAAAGVLEGSGQPLPRLQPPLRRGCRRASQYRHRRQARYAIAVVQPGSRAAYRRPQYPQRPSSAHHRRASVDAGQW